jgi:hypothetical protein
MTIKSQESDLIPAPVFPDLITEDTEYQSTMTSSYSLVGFFKGLPGNLRASRPAPQIPHLENLSVSPQEGFNSARKLMNLGGIVKNNPIFPMLGFLAFPLSLLESALRHSPSALEFSIMGGEYPTAEIHPGKG